MHGLLAPVMAQLVTLALGDRIEAQYLISEEQRTFESSNRTTPGAALTFDWGRAQLTFAYAPTLTVVPLEETPREVLLLHAAIIDGQYRWRRTTLGLNQSATYGERDLRREAVGADGAVPGASPDDRQTAGQTPQNPSGAPGGATPPTPGGSAGAGGAPAGPTAPTTPAAPALATQVRYGSYRSSASLDHVMSRALSLRLSGGYTIAGGADRESRATIPLVRGPDATASGGYAPDGRNTFTTTLASQLAYSENGDDAFVATLSEDYLHRFTRHTSTTVGAGIALSRAKPRDGLPLYGVYPTGRAGVTHDGRAAGGTYSLTLAATTAPVLDLTTASVDPRLGGSLTASWTRRRFSLTAAGGTALSLTPERSTALDTISSSLTASYDLGAGFLVDAGVRGVWQRYGGNTLIQPSAVLFAGLAFGAAVPLNPRRR